MNFVFLSPHFPPQYQLFCKALRDAGVNVFGVADAPFHDLSQTLRESLTEYVQVASMDHYDNVLRAVGQLTGRHGKMDRLDSLNEHWLETEGRLRDDFNIEGPRLADTLKRRSKAGMKEVFRAHDIPVPEGETLSSAAQLRAFVQKHGLPIVIKPDVGVGAAGAFKVTSKAELEEVLTKLPGQAIVEEFIQGRIVSFDGLTDASGKIVFHVSHVYSNGIMDVVIGGLDMHYTTRREIPAALETLGARAVQAFGLKSRFFHFEFFEREDGSYRALEGNFRPPGGFTTDMMNFACDVDVYALWASVQARGVPPPDFKYEHKYYCSHVARRFGRAYKVPHHEVLKELGSALIIYREMPPIFAGAMGDLMYLIRHPDPKELTRMIDVIKTLA